MAASNFLRVFDLGHRGYPAPRRPKMQLEKIMGFAPGELEKAAEAYEKDEWPKGRTIKLGRPPISDEPSVVLSARVGESVLEAFDAKAERHGQTRTERLRELITLDAMIA